MKKLRVMLCCGAGMSSGFLAQKTRQAAKKAKQTYRLMLEVNHRLCSI